MKNHESGQGLLEYLILVCIISISAIGIVSVVGKNIKEQYANISNALQKKQKVKLTAPSQEMYQSRGMDDFMESSRQQE